MWLIIVEIILLIISITLSILLRPKLPANPINDDGNAPLASANAPIPVVFGTRRISQPNVVWYGDISTTPIKGGSK